MSNNYHAKNARVYLGYIEISRGQLTGFEIDDGYTDLDGTTVGDSVERMEIDLHHGAVTMALWYIQNNNQRLRTILASAQIVRGILTGLPNGAALGELADLIYGYSQHRQAQGSQRSIVKLDADMDAEGGVRGGIVVGPARTETLWHALTAYSLGQIVKPQSGAHNGHYYTVTTAGTSGGAAPTWPTSNGGTVTNGDVVFTESGTTRIDRGSGAATTGLDWAVHFHMTAISGGATIHDAVMMSPNLSAWTELAGVDYSVRNGLRASNSSGDVYRYLDYVTTEVSGTLASVTHLAALSAL